MSSIRLSIPKSVILGDLSDGRDVMDFVEE